MVTVNRNKRVYFLSARLLLGITASVGVGCTGRATEHGVGSEVPPAAKSASAATTGVVNLTQPYPPGRWRLASGEELSRVVLWASHILIRHEAVQPGIVSFNLGDWTPAPAAPQRTRTRAYELALSIAERLKLDTSNFASVARQVSEDVATRDQGGSLGGVCASELQRRQPEVLDLLAELRPGELSRVVETAHGFHIFLRRPPPQEEVVSGSRIVIGYDQAPWLNAFLARRAVPPRRRERAIALAESLYARVRAGENFEQLVEEHTDHAEASRYGDFGAWSTRQCSPFPREIELLQQLEVGEVAPPMDSAFGVQLIRRTATRPRHAVAMSAIQQPYDVTRPDEAPNSRRAVLDNMQRLSAELLDDPTGFEAHQKSYCCTSVAQWSEGQGSAPAEQALASLLPGEIAPAPVDIGAAYAIIKRVVPSAEVTPAFSFDLPAPSAPNLRELARLALLNYQMPAAGQRCSQALGLDAELAERFVALHQAEGQISDESDEERVARFESFIHRVGALLGSARHGEYLKLLDKHFEEVLLARRENRPRDFSSLSRP